jgi:hypothetical protein
MAQNSKMTKYAGSKVAIICGSVLSFATLIGVVAHQQTAASDTSQAEVIRQIIVRERAPAATATANAPDAPPATQGSSASSSEQPVQRPVTSTRGS